MWTFSKRQEPSTWNSPPTSPLPPTLLQGISPWSNESSHSTFERTSIRQTVGRWKFGPKLPNLLNAERKKSRLNLTDPSYGLFRQKTDQNLSELVTFLLESYQFANIGGRLALYQHPCWELIPPKNILRALSALLADETVSAFLSSQQMEEIATRVLASPCIPAFQELPPLDHHVICCQDALYDWEADRIIPSSSQAMRFSCLAVDTQDIAPTETPYFDAFIEGVGGDELFRQSILEVIGTIVTGFPCKNFFVLEGPSDCGKSQLARFLKGLLGEQSCFALNDIGQLGDRWTTGQLPGKLLCLCSDVPNKPLGPKAVGTIKQLTGDDPIHGEEKYQTPFVFQNTAKLLFLTNFPLKISGGVRDRAFDRRMVVVLFPNAVPESQQIPHLSDHMLDEAGGILWLALQALKDLEARGGEFTTAVSSLESYEVAPETVDPLDKLTAFVNTCCAFESDAVSSVGELYEGFRQFEGEHFPYTLSITNAVFGKLIRRLALPITEEREATRRCFRGIRLCHPDEEISFQ